MPTVSTYGPRKVATTPIKTPLRTAAETEASTGVGIDQARAGKWGAIAQAGQQAAQLGQVIGEEAIKQRAEATQFAHEVAITEADNKLAAWEHQVVYDPETGALTRKGKAAMGVIEEVGDAYTKFAGEISSRLGTDQQRLEFEQRSSARRQSLDLTLRRHVNQEMTAYAAGELDAAVKLAQNDAIANALDPVRVGRSLDNAVGTLEKLGPSVGVGPDALAVAIGKVRTDTHVGVIESLLAQKESQKARAYFEEVRDQINGAAVPRLEAMIATARTAVVGLASSEAIWLKLGPKTDDDPINLDKMETEARTRYADDPDTLESTIRFLRERKSGVDASRKDREEANTSGLWTAVSRGASLAELSRMPAYLAAPGRLQAQLADYVQNKLTAEANRVYAAEGRAAAAEGRAYTARQRAAQDKETAGWAKYWELSDPEMLSKMSDDQVLAKRGEIGDDHVNRLMTQKRTLGKSAEAVHAATIDDDLFKTTAAAAGLDAYSPKTDQEKSDLGQLKNTVETLIDQAQRKDGKVIGRDAKQKIMQDVIDQKVMLNVWGRDPERIAALVTNAADRAVAYVPLAKMPASVLTEYLNFARSLTPATQRMPDAELRARFGDRIQHAYALRILGGSRAEIDAALKGQD